MHDSVVMGLTVFLIILNALMFIWLVWNFAWAFWNRRVLSKKLKLAVVTFKAADAPIFSAAAIGEQTVSACTPPAGASNKVVPLMMGDTDGVESGLWTPAHTAGEAKGHEEFSVSQSSSVGFQRLAESGPVVAQPKSSEADNEGTASFEKMEMKKRKTKKKCRNMDAEASTEGATSIKKKKKKKKRKTYKKGGKVDAKAGTDGATPIEKMMTGNVEKTGKNVDKETTKEDATSKEEEQNNAMGKGRGR